MQDSLKVQLEKLCQKDARYDIEAYLFVLDALDATQRQRTSDAKRPVHLSGQELLEGIRQFALTLFGPLAFTVLDEWGVHRTEDFGELVFNMIELGYLGKSTNDSKDDFIKVYDFEESFLVPFEPRATPRPRSKSSLPAKPSRDA